MRRDFSRREFLYSAAALGSAAAGLEGKAGGPFGQPQAGRALPYKGKFCLFSKPLPEMDWRRLAESARRLGFDGIDLTVRPGGHVKPERAAEDLPRAVAAIRGEGLDVPMMTTGLVSASDPTARAILSTAAGLSIPCFKPGYYEYALVNVREELRKVGEQFRGLADLAKECGIELGYHNHEGYVGAPVWDMASVIEPLDAKWVGYYFDVRHAVAEGGVGGWKIAANLVAPRLKMVAVKDLYWEKTAKGWQDRNCPLGEGMVNWKYYFAALARAGFEGPMSLHLEYEVPGRTIAEREENTLRALRRDLDFLKARVQEAYGDHDK